MGDSNKIHVAPPPQVPAGRVGGILKEKLKGEKPKSLEEGYSPSSSLLVPGREVSRGLESREVSPPGSVSTVVGRPFPAVELGVDALPWMAAQYLGENGGFCAPGALQTPLALF